MKTIRIGTRGSKLALVQAELVKAQLEAHHPDHSFELTIIHTQGDKRLDLALNTSGDKGLFTRELENALYSGEIDLAVHSLKDLPVTPAAGTAIGAILKRETTEDVLLGQYTLEELPEGAIVGTSSNRRMRQLLIHYPHLNIQPIRGNVDTRIAKLESGQYDAIIMARAGLRRLGLEEKIKEIIPENIIVPAPGQAAIAIQQRTDDQAVANLVRPLNDEQTYKEVSLERELLSQLGGGCALPFGCVCHIEDPYIHLKAFYASASGELAAYRSLKCRANTLSVEVSQLLNELKLVETGYED